MFDKILEAMEMEKEYYFVPEREYFYDMNSEEITVRLNEILSRGVRVVLAKNRCLYMEEGIYLLLTLIDPALRFTITGITDENEEVFSEDEIIEKNDGIIEELPMERAESTLLNLIGKCSETEI